MVTDLSKATMQCSRDNHRKRDMENGVGEACRPGLEDLRSVEEVHFKLSPVRKVRNSQISGEEQF